jgi:hypothetical protein
VLLAFMTIKASALRLFAVMVMMKMKIVPAVITTPAVTILAAMPQMMP